MSATPEDLAAALSKLLEEARESGHRAVDVPTPLLLQALDALAERAARPGPPPPRPGVRVLRLLEYVYPDAAAAEIDMQRWLQQSPPENKVMRMRSASLPFESVLDEEPPRERALFKELLRMTQAGVAEALDHLAEGRAEEARQTLSLHLGPTWRRRTGADGASGRSSSRPPAEQTFPQTPADAASAPLTPQPGQPTMDLLVNEREGGL